MRGNLASLGALALAMLARAQAMGPSLLHADASAFPEVVLALDPADLDPDALRHASVLEGTIAGSDIAVEPLGAWTVYVVLDAGPHGNGVSDGVRAACRAVANSLPEDTRVGLVLAGHGARVLGASRALSRLTELPPEAFGADRACIRDAILTAALALRSVRGPRAIVAVVCGEDSSSRVPESVFRAISPFLGAPLFVLAVGGQVDLSISAAATAGGGGMRSVAPESDAAAVTYELLSPLRRAVAVRYRSTMAPSSGWWQTVSVETNGPLAHALSGGYQLPGSGDTPRLVPVVEAPTEDGRPVTVIYDAGGSTLRAWGYAGDEFVLRAGRYRVVCGTWPILERTVSASAGSQRIVLGSAGALRLGLPPRLGCEAPYDILSERTGEPVGRAWSGEWVPLLPGPYRVKLVGDLTYEQSMVGISAGASRHLDLSGCATLKVELEDMTGRHVAAAIQLEEPTVGARAVAVTDRTVLLSPGQWRVTVATRPLTEHTVVLQPGEDATLRLEPLGALVVELLASDGSPADTPWTAMPVGRSDAFSGTANVQSDVPAGDYHVRLLTAPPLEFTVHVESGARTIEPVGRLARFSLEILGHDGTERRIKYSLLEAETGVAVAVGLTGVPQDVRPGSYLADLWTFPALRVERLEVASDESFMLHLGSLGAVRVTADYPASVGLTRIGEEETVPAAVVDTGELVEVLPGVYTASVLEPRSIEYTSTLTVRSGEVTDVRLPRLEVQ